MSHPWFCKAALVKNLTGSLRTSQDLQRPAKDPYYKDLLHGRILKISWNDIKALLFTDLARIFARIFAGTLMGLWELFQGLWRSLKGAQGIEPWESLCQGPQGSLEQPQGSLYGLWVFLQDPWSSLRIYGRGSLRSLKDPVRFVFSPECDDT